MLSHGHDSSIALRNPGVLRSCGASNKQTHGRSSGVGDAANQMFAEGTPRLQERIFGSSYLITVVGYRKLHYVSSELLVRDGTVPFSIDLIISAVFEQH